MRQRREVLVLVTKIDDSIMGMDAPLASIDDMPSAATGGSSPRPVRVWPPDDRDLFGTAWTPVKTALGQRGRT